VAETESDVKKGLGKWFVDEKSRIAKEKDKVLTKVALAQHEARRQRITTEKDAEVAAAHTHLYGKDRVGRVAAAEEAFAAQGLKAATKSASAVTGAAKHQLTQMDRDITEHYKELYDFALAALEKSLPGETVVPAAAKHDPPPVEDAPHHKKKKKRHPNQ
jgi:hypothetical protein